MRKRKSKIWDIDKDNLVEMVNGSNSLSAVLKKLGMTTKGTSSFQSLKRRLLEDKIDYSHIKLGLNSNKGKKFPNAPKLPLSEFLIENSNASRANIRKRLIKEGVLEYKCSKCDIKDWQNEPISLQLDHINGVPDDNRLCNLRLLCPNCHSQTKNFAGRANKKNCGVM